MMAYSRRLTEETRTKIRHLASPDYPEVIGV